MPRKLGDRRSRDREAAVDSSVASILAGGRTALRALFNLKSMPRPVMRRVLHRVSRKPELVPHVFGNPTPFRLGDFPRLPPTVFTERLDAELVWASEVAVVFGERISAFIHEKGRFEAALLGEDFAGAREILKGVTKDLGWSLWAVAQHLLLAELSDGLHKQKEVLAQLCDEIPDAVTRTIVGHLSERAEQKMSAAVFEKTLIAFVRRFESSEAGDRANWLVNYIRYRVNLHSLRDSVAMAYQVWHESRYSVYDQYLCLVRILILLTSAPHPHRYADAIASAVNALRPAVADPRLSHLRLLVEPSEVPPLGSIYEAIREITNAYTIGDYEATVKLASDALLKNPDVFDFYELLAKSLVHRAAPLPVVGGRSSLRQSILGHLVRVIARGDETASSLDTILKFALMLDGSPLGDQLYGFHVEQRDPDGLFRGTTFGRVSGSLLTARFSTAYVRAFEARKFLTAFHRRTSGRDDALTLYLETYGSDGSSGLAAPVPDPRRLKHLALMSARNKHFSVAADLYRSLLDQFAGDPIHAQDAVIGLYSCLTALGRYAEAVDLVVSLYLGRKELLTPIKIKDLLDRNEEADLDLARGHVGWPILYYIHYTENGLARDNYKIYAVLDAFLFEQGVDRPSGLTSHFLSTYPRIGTFVLRHVCVLDVLDFSIAFNSSESLELERVKILQQLSELDPGNASSYASQIATLTHQSLVRHALHYVDESRVYVDTGHILERLDKPLREKYERYVALSQIRDERVRKVLVIRVLALGTEREQIVFTDPGQELFADFFLDLRDHFISNNEYGLDSYLSVRIRHGTLSGQIRSVFESAHLVTRMGKSGKYASNSYWQERAAELGTADDLAALDSRFVELSRTVDDIIETVRSRWIQIKGKTNNYEGMFDYDFSTMELLPLYERQQGAKSYEEVVSMVFEFLWARTEINLRAIRSRVMGELASELAQAIDRFESGISALNASLRTQLATSVTQCRTNVQMCMRIISGWFNPNEKRMLPDFEFEHLVRALIEYIHRLFPTAIFDPEVAVENGIRFQGWTFPHFVDVAFILLENMIKYGLGAKQAARISAEGGGGVVEVVMSNLLPPETDTAELAVRVEQLSREAADFAAVRTEGGSGFKKLRKIIRYDLGRDDAGVNFGIEDGAFVARICFRKDGMAA